MNFTLKPLAVLAFLFLTGCEAHLTHEAQVQQCKEYGHKDGTPEFGECMQTERKMAQDFWLSD